MKRIQIVNAIGRTGWGVVFSLVALVASMGCEKPANGPGTQPATPPPVDAPAEMSTGAASSNQSDNQNDSNRDGNSRALNPEKFPSQ
jgi:hypothetical protein